MSDLFLHPALCFVSPSQTGLKLFVHIKNAKSELHLNYFAAVTYYLKSLYNLDVDKSGSDIPRPCFLCHDSTAEFNTFGYITHDVLISYFNELPPETPAVVPLTKPFIPPNYDKFPFVKDGQFSLNENSKILTMSYDLLHSAGWTNNDLFWYKPLKEKLSKYTAVYSYFSPYSIYLFYVWSDNAPPFSPNTAYTPVQVFSKLKYNDNYDECIKNISLELNNSS